MKYRKIREYQADALQYGIHIVHPAYFMEMGLGKALVAIRTCKLFRCKKILIAGPSETFYGWQDELFKEHEPQAIELTGTKQERLDKLYEKGKFYIINKEGHLSLPDIAYIKWDMVILDESTFIKSPSKNNVSKVNKLKRANVTRFYCSNFRNVNHRMILTGLPDPEHLLDYFQQLQFLNPEIFGNMNFWSFRAKYFYEYYYQYKLRPRITKLFYKILADNCFFLKRKDAGLHIEEVEEIRTIAYTPEMKKVYKRLRNEFILQYKTTDKRTKYAPVKIAWLRQLASGFVDSELKFPGKLNALIDLLHGELKGKQVIVYCQFICEIEAIQKKLKNKCKVVYGKVKGKERATIKEDFDNTKFDVLILQSSCWQYGLNLGYVNTMIFFSLPFGQLTYNQNKARIKRGKKKDFVLMIYLMLENSVEQKIYKSLQKKQTESQLTQQIIKDIINENTN